MNEPINSNIAKYKKSSQPSFKKEAIKLGVVVLFIFLLSGGVIGYTAGLMLWDSLFVVHIYGSLLSPLLLLYYSIRLPIRILSLKRAGSTWTEIRLLFITAMILVIILAIVVQFTVVDAPGYVPGHGFRHRMLLKADIPAIQSWLKEQQPELTETGWAALDSSDWPECIKNIKPNYVRVEGWDSERVVRLSWKFGFGMGLVVALKMSETRPSHNILPLCQGAYVWQGEK